MKVPDLRVKIHSGELSILNLPSNSCHMNNVLESNLPVWHEEEEGI